MSETRYWAVVPAAGVGSRMGSAKPKQYLSLNGKPVIQHTLERLSSHPRIAGLVLVISADDTYWSELNLIFDKPLIVAHGGSERCHSVLNGLRRLSEWAKPMDWVLVHDAARPCLRHSDIDALIDTIGEHPVGGILGLPVTETVKRTDAQGNIMQTVDRLGLWRAATPQMFRFAALRDSLEIAINDDYWVTDEASALEHAQRFPRMVQGASDNIKITTPQDLELAELFLRQQEGV